MKEIIITTIVAIIAVMAVAEPKINISPFKVQFAKPWFAIGIALIGIGVGFVRYQGHKDGAIEGIDATFKYLKEELKK